MIYESDRNLQRVRSDAQKVQPVVSDGLGLGPALLHGKPECFMLVVAALVRVYQPSHVPALLRGDISAFIHQLPTKNLGLVEQLLKVKVVQVLLHHTHALLIKAECATIQETVQLYSKDFNKSIMIL